MAEMELAFEELGETVYVVCMLWTFKTRMSTALLPKPRYFIVINSETQFELIYMLKSLRFQLYFA